ncbi:MAG: succinylglutamate desuccinylase/aspartoacylase family protein [Haloarculaceae archaeon]
MERTPVAHTTREVTLARLPSGREITTRVHEYVGADAGPTVYLQAAQHGIELNGPAVLRRLHDRLREADLAGTVRSVPVANPIAFDHRSYMAPAELDVMNSNMNRVWPGNDDGTLQERMVARLWEFVADADAVVDLHTGMADTLEHVVFMSGNDLSKELADVFGIEVLMAEEIDDDDDSEWTERDFHAKLRNTATRAGIPAITPELSNSRRITHDAVECGVDGVVNVLRDLDALAGAPDADGTHDVLRNHIGRVDVRHSGLFEPDADVTVGDSVRAGDHLGVIYDPATFETLQEPTVDRDGVLYSLRRESTCIAGESIASVAVPVE